MRYIDKKSHQIPRKNPPKCLANWIWIIIAAKDIQFVLKNAGFEYLNLKYLNRDVIENYFSQLKSNSYANTNPIPEQFQGI